MIIAMKKTALSTSGIIWAVPKKGKCRFYCQSFIWSPLKLDTSWTVYPYLPRAAAPEEGDDEDEDGRDEDDDGRAVVHLDHVRLGVGHVGQVDRAVTRDQSVPAHADHDQGKDLRLRSVVNENPGEKMLKSFPYKDDEVGCEEQILGHVLDPRIHAHFEGLLLTVRRLRLKWSN